MKLTPLPFRSSVQDYERQATEGLKALLAGDREAMRVFRENHPRFLDEKIPWLPKNMADSEILAAGLDLKDARLVTARSYSFQDWERLVEWVEAVRIDGLPVCKFETAVEGVIHGDETTLATLLGESPDLVRARSTIVTCHDPPVHASTLLHYLAANGVEGYRQKSPKNAVNIARILLDAGAAPDALAGMYGGQCTTMSMLVSSSHPADAGVQVPLVEILVDYGASVNECGNGEWTSPLMTALVFGYLPAAEALVRRGARVDNIVALAGLGRVDEFRRTLNGANADERHRALALASILGQVEIVKLLLDAGEDPNRYNPKGMHGHATPLHHAVCFGHEGLVRLLVERGAKLDGKDTIYQSTPLGWAEHCEKPAIAEYLRAQSAVNP